LRFASNGCRGVVVNWADFPRAMVSIAQNRTLPEVLQSIVAEVGACKNVVVTCIWLIDRGDLCESCRFRVKCPDQSRCLHLVASAGNLEAHLQDQRGYRDQPCVTTFRFGGTPGTVARAVSRASPKPFFTATANEKTMLSPDSPWCRERESAPRISKTIQSNSTGSSRLCLIPTIPLQ
jgi:hypothetical protein